MVEAPPRAPLDQAQRQQHGQVVHKAHEQKNHPVAQKTPLEEGFGAEFFGQTSPEGCSRSSDKGIQAHDQPDPNHRFRRLIGADFNDIEGEAKRQPKLRQSNENNALASV